MPTPGVNFDGIGNGFHGYTVTVAPPDTNGDVGPNHYVQIVNTDFAVFNKLGTLLFGPVPINTVWAGFGGGCQTNNDGDPIVLYDPIADRWVISQFSVTTTPYLECVAVSQTGDPTGAYNRYAFSYGNVEFIDYPKLGVWPDAYYVTYNVFNRGTTFAGAKFCAFDRAKMLAGQPATQQCFPNTSTSFGGVLPSDLDGSRLPPAGAPNYLVAQGATDGLVYWKFHVDWTTPVNSTLTGPTIIAGAPSYTLPCNGVAGACVPQAGAGASLLDTLGDRLMYRLAYRNFGDHQALVVNHSVQSGSSTGVRWYELRVGAGNTLDHYQSGTYAPDANHRWMGSAAQDQTGNMAIGYSVSSSSISPQIHFTGRLAGDALGTLTQGENTIINGSGSQTGGLTRWGDYSSMGVDPTDDCTFWFTTEYLKASGSFNWSTRIASFKLPGCPAALPVPDFALSATPASQTVIRGAGTSYTVTVAPSGGFAGSVNLSVSGLPADATGTFAPNPATGTSTLSVSTASTTPTGTFPLTITGTSGALTHTATATLVVNEPPDFTVSVTPASRTIIQGNSTTYDVSLARTGAFADAVTISVGGLGAGATGTFSPNGITGNASTLTISSSAAAAVGTFPLTITATGGGITHTASATLVVDPAPDFSLAASPASQTLTAGQTGTYAVSVARVGGFADAVTFSVSGLPGGTTGTFSPGTTVGNSSTLTVTTSASTPGGTYPLTITGTGGTLTRTAAATLVVEAPPRVGFSLRALPVRETLAPGQRGGYVIVIVRTGGFAGPVSFSVSGLPAGTAASFRPSPTSGFLSVLTVTPGAGTPDGTYPLLITGTSGAMTRAVGVTLVVQSTQDFVLSAFPMSATVTAGGGAAFAIGVARVGGFPGTVGLSVSGLPAGASAFFIPSSVGILDIGSVLFVQTVTTTPHGTYPLDVVGTSGALTHSTPLTLVVQ